MYLNFIRFLCSLFTSKTVFGIRFIKFIARDDVLPEKTEKLKILPIELLYCAEISQIH